VLLRRSLRACIDLRSLNLKFTGLAQNLGQL
jgi:hypothetical protein